MNHSSELPAVPAKREERTEKCDTAASLHYAKEASGAKRVH